MTQNASLTAAAPLLSMRDVYIEGKSGSGWIPLLKGIDLTLYRGEILGLIGESGAGKSTLGLAAMGHTRDGCRIKSGSILFDGIDMLAAPESTRRQIRGKRIAYVAQSAAASFNPAHRLIDQYCEGPIEHQVMKRAVAMEDAVKLYQRMRLPNPTEIGFRYPHQVSGGQLQRAMTAMAMACRPDLIVFDEPTTALDVTTQIEVLAAIRDIVNHFHTAAIYITHDLPVVAQMAHRIKVLLRGEEVEEQETRSMLSAPKEEYTRSLWAVRSFSRDQATKPSEKQDALVSVSNITAGYGDLNVLEQVSFDIYKARTVALVGESGSGKSTTAKVLTGLVKPKNGEVLLQAKRLPPDYRQRSKEQLRQIQFIYQSADTALNPKLRLREIIGRPAQLFTDRCGKQLTERVRELLDVIGLEPDIYIDRLPSELSGGQRQRIGIARALAAEPKCIICDEVTSALDQKVAEGILQLLERLQTQFELGYVFITHDLNTVRAIADEVVVMQAGRIVEHARGDVLFSSPQHAYTRQLLESVPKMNPDWLSQLVASRVESSR